MRECTTVLDPTDDRRLDILYLKDYLTRRDEYGVSRTEDRRARPPKNRLQPLVQSTSGEAALPRPQGDFLEILPAMQSKIRVRW